MAMRWILVLAGVSTACGQIALGQIMEEPPKAWETRLPQAGAFNGYFSWVGGLRCEVPGEAFVGVRVRAGTVMDAIQIACAKVTCQSSDCNWTSYYTAGSAGNLSGGNQKDWMLCKPGEMVSGYRAAVRSV